MVICDSSRLFWNKGKFCRKRNLWISHLCWRFTFVRFFTIFMTQLFSVFQSSQFRIWETSFLPSYAWYEKGRPTNGLFIFCFCLLWVCFRNISFLNRQTTIYHSQHHHWLCWVIKAANTFESPIHISYCNFPLSIINQIHNHLLKINRGFAKISVLPTQPFWIDGHSWQHLKKEYLIYEGCQSSSRLIKHKTPFSHNSLESTTSWPLLKGQKMRSFTDL